MEARSVTTESNFVMHVPCPLCGSSDAGSLYDDGHCFCFVCQKPFTQDGSELPASAAAPKVDADLQAYLARGSIVSHPKRGLTQATCKHWGYLGNAANADHLSPYCDAHGVMRAIKVRHPDKTFTWIGNHKECSALYGRWLWGQGGKMVVVTEGEIDALSVSQAFGNKFAVCSVRDGAQTAAKCVAKELEWLSSYERVVFMFDMDDPGRAAAIECARLLPPGKAFIAKLTEKDANELLKKGKQEEITRAAWNAEQYRPDGIVSAVSLFEAALHPPTSGLTWPWEFLTNWTYGRRYGEVYTFGAGTGIGKTDAIDEVVAHTLSVNKEAVAVFSYERGPAQTLKSIAGKLYSRRFHIPDPEGDFWTLDELKDALRSIEHECAPLFINDHFGGSDWASIKERIRYLFHAEGVRHFVIDPLSAMVVDSDDERRDLDKIVLEAATLASGLGICVYLVSHLTRPDFGPSHEEGGQVRLKQFRGSNAIGMFSTYVIGLERDQQADEPSERLRTLWRCVKDRYTGNSVGLTAPTYYDRISGRLEEAEALTLPSEAAPPSD